MSKKLKVQGPATPEEVEAALKASMKHYERERLLALKMAQQEDWTMSQIAKTLGRGRATIGR